MTDNVIKEEQRLEYSIRRIGLPDAAELLSFLKQNESCIVGEFHPHPIDSIHVELFLCNKLSGLVDVFVAEIDGRIVGCIWLFRMQEDVPWLVLCVSESFRREDFCEALMVRAIEEGIVRKKKGICVAVTEDDTSAISFCRRMGFKLSDEHVSDSYRSARLMKLDLAERQNQNELLSIIRKRLNNKRIHIVPYCHCDWAWTHTRNWHERRYALVFREVLEIMEQHPEFRWYQDNYVCQYLPLKKYCPELLPMLRKHVKEGRITICGGYSNVRPNMVGDETFIRNQVIGRQKWLEEFPGADLSVHADAVDVAVGHPQMPQLLKLSGYTYLRMWRPSIGLSFKGIPYEFIWRGLDGTEIITSRGCYGGMAWASEDLLRLLENPSSDWDRVVASVWDWELEHFSRYGNADIWVSHGMDDARPLRLHDDTPIELHKLIAEWNSREESEMIWATPQEYFSNLEKYELPVVSGTLDPCDVAFNAAWNGEKGLGARRILQDRLLTSAEIYAALASIYGYAYPEGQLEKLWCKHLTTCAHATQWLYTKDFEKMYAWSQDVINQAGELADDALDFLVCAIDLPEDTEWVVFNPLPYKRKVTVELTISVVDSMKNWLLEDANGNVLPVQIIKEYCQAHEQSGCSEYDVLTQIELPAMGYAPLRRVPSAEQRGACIARKEMDNGLLNLKIEDHRIMAVRTLEHVYEGGYFGEPVFTRVDTSVEDTLHVGPILEQVFPVWEACEIVETGPIRWKLKRTGNVAGCPVELNTFLYAGETRIEHRLYVDWQGLDGYLAARLDLFSDGWLGTDIPFGFEEKRLELETYGVYPDIERYSQERLRENMFYGRSFATYRNAEKGVTLISHDGNRYFIYDKDGGYLDHILLNSIGKASGWEKNINDAWLMGKGEHEFVYSVLFHSGDWREVNLPNISQEIIAPPVIRAPYRDKRDGEYLPAEHSMLWLKPKGVLLSALYCKDGWIYLRCYEALGKQSDVEIEFPVCIKKAKVVDFHGRSCVGPRLIVDQTRIEFLIKPWQIVTIAIQGAK